MAMSVVLTGSGAVGPVMPGWSVAEEATPSVVGDSSGAVGSASVKASKTGSSRYVLDNAAVTVSPAGSFVGRVSGVSVGPLEADLSLVGGLGFLVADRILAPTGFENTAKYSFVVQGAATGQVAYVGSMAVAADGSVYVASRGSYAGTARNVVIKYTASGTYVLEFGSGVFNGLSGLRIAVSPVDGSVYVSDRNSDRVHRYTSAGVFVGTYATSGSGNGQLNFPQGITVDGSGNFYVVDFGNKRVQKFNATGTYQAQVSLAGTTDITAIGYGNSTIYVAYYYTPASTYVPQISTYNTSLVLQNTMVVPEPPVGNPTTQSVNPIGGLAVNSDGTFWLTYQGNPFVGKYTASGVLTSSFVGSAEQPGQLIAVSASGVVYFTPDIIYGTYLGNRVSSFNYTPLALSATIQRYMLAADTGLGGYTYSYTAASDPTVTAPAWSGNVWVKLKELCAAYRVEIVVVGTEIRVRDIGSTVLTVPNRTPVQLAPENVAGGRQINIVYQSPVVGGVVVWDAKTENSTVTIGVGETQTFTVVSPHSLGAVYNPVNSGGPIYLGRYSVIDSTGASISGALWSSAGGNVTASLGADSETVTVTITGPQVAVPGFTAPYRFATTATPTVGNLSIVGDGLILSPKTVQLNTGAAPSSVANQVSQTINNIFIDTVDRAYSRGVWAALEASGPTVQIQFSMPTAQTAGLGLTIGSLITHEGSTYRATSLVWGDLMVAVTADRYATLGEQDTAWAGQTLATRDTFWSGYSLGDRTIQPNLTVR